MVLDADLDSPNIQSVRQGEVEGARVDFTNHLREGETLSSVSSIAIQGPSTAAVTAASAAVSTSSLNVLTASASAGTVVTFALTAGSTASVGKYEALITVVTSSSRTLKRKIGMLVVGTT